MAKHSFLGGIITFTAAAATVAGLCYVFKDEIKGSKPYQDLNDKYDVDSKINTAASKAKTAKSELKAKASDIKTKASDIKDDIMEKASQASWKKDDEDEIFDEDEIILNDSCSNCRDYVPLNSDDENDDKFENDEAHDESSVSDKSIDNIEVE